MNTELTLEAVDRDGAIAETLHELTGGTRADLLRTAVVGGAAAAAALAAPAVAQPRNTATDIAILRFDLTLEYLQAAMYSEAERLRELRPRTLEWSRVVGANERGHVKAIRGLLGRDAVKSPKFNFRGVTEDDRVFTETAVAFEDLTAALLKTQATQLDSRGILAAIVSLHSVEARHAAWIRHIAGIVPAADAFDEATSKRRVVRLVDSTNFVTSTPRTKGRRRPRFTG
ncbi:MAG: ferritin-like domain-containing protein [Actinomycetota bacterium]|nr:ferritin-like domain-containing protein [Actinomycetota bacterium]